MTMNKRLQHLVLCLPPGLVRDQLAKEVERSLAQAQADILDDMADMVNPDNPGKSLRGMAADLRSKV